MKLYCAHLYNNLNPAASGHYTAPETDRSKVERDIEMWTTSSYYQNIDLIVLTVSETHQHKTEDLRIPRGNWYAKT